MTVEYPLVRLSGKGPENLFDGDVLEFDHSIFKASNKHVYDGTVSTPQR